MPNQADLERLQEALQSLIDFAKENGKEYYYEMNEQLENAAARLRWPRLDGRWIL